MASFLASLLSNFQSPQVVQGNTSYGPAQTRITHTPITFNPNMDVAGIYHDESPVHKIASAILPSVFPPGGSIEINPSGTTDVGRTTKHEQVHALLHGAGIDSLDQNNQLDQLNAANSVYSQLNPNTDVGTKSAEMPAYAATNEGAEVGIPLQIMQNYRQELTNQLMKLDPKIASMYQKLSSK